MSAITFLGQTEQLRQAVKRHSYARWEVAAHQIHEKTVEAEQAPRGCGQLEEENKRLKTW